MENLSFFYGSSNQELGKNIAARLRIKPGMIEIKKFANGETYIRLLENIRGQDVYLMQTAVEPINDNLMELLIMIDAAKLASAGKITIVMPAYFYARQDRKSASREPITARLVADLLERAGADRIITLEVHSDQSQGFFNVPFDNLSPKRIFIGKVKELGLDAKDCIVVSPDAGAAKQATKISKMLGCGLSIINKVRTTHNESDALHIIGDNVNGKHCLIFDDMVDTGGSLCLAADLIKKSGAENVYAFITHGMFSGDAVKKIDNSGIDMLYTTNTIPLRKKSKKIEVIDVSDYFAEAIQHIHENKSISILFDKGLEDQKRL